MRAPYMITRQSLIDRRMRILLYSWWVITLAGALVIFALFWLWRFMWFACYGRIS